MLKEAHATYTLSDGKNSNNNKIWVARLALTFMANGDFSTERPPLMI